MEDVIERETFLGTGRRSIRPFIRPFLPCFLSYQRFVAKSLCNYSLQYDGLCSATFQVWYHSHLDINPIFADGVAAALKPLSELA
jgi:hypothetical protein